MADVSCRVETAARRFNLDFIPIIGEQYVLTCEKKSLGGPLLVAAQDAMVNSAFGPALATLPGYDGAFCGTRLDMHALF